MKALAFASVSSLSTPMTRTRESAPPAASCCRRTSAVKSGSSWWQLGHQAPKKSSTVGLVVSADDTDRCAGPAGPKFWAENEGTGPLSWGGAAVVPWLDPRLV